MSPPPHPHPPHPRHASISFFPLVFIMLLCPSFRVLCSIASTVTSLSNVSEREFCWGNVDLSHLEIAPWCFGFKGKDLNYSHELQEHSALLFPTSNCQYFQVQSCWKLHSWVQYWKAALVLWFDNVIVKATGKRRKANSGPERCLKRCQRLSACKRRRWKPSQGIPGAPKAFMFCCLSDLYQSFFTSTIMWTSTGLCHMDFIFKICPSE